jgi:sulfur carrier protein
VKFVLNGETQEAAAPLSVLDLLQLHDLQQRRVAVAINSQVVPRSRFAQVQVDDGDRVEVIQAVGGG